jgi:hypothetical protein
MRRIVAFAAAFVAAFCILARPALACERTHAGADWACLYVEHVDTGVCQQNPLPQELPVPVPEELRVVPDEVPELAPLVESVVLLIPDVKPSVPSNPTSLVPTVPTPQPANPMALVPAGAPVPRPAPPPPLPPAPRPPYQPTGLPGSPI